MTRDSFSRAMRFHQGCGRKIYHETKESARKQIEEVGDQSLEVYSCKFCGGYHVGHSSRGKKRNRGRDDTPDRSG